jgi:hypothetical protein
MIASSAFEMGNRSSMVTPEIVAQMGFVPRGLYERKLTVGQQRRPRAKKPAQRGGAGSLNSWNDNYTLLGLQKYARHHNIDDSGTKTDIAARLNMSSKATLGDFDRLIQNGRISKKDGAVVTTKGAKRTLKFPSIEVEPQPETASDDDGTDSGEDAFNSPPGFDTPAPDNPPTAVNAPSNEGESRGKFLAEGGFIKLAARAIQKELEAASGKASGAEPFSEGDYPADGVNFLQDVVKSVSQGKSSPLQLAGDVVLFSQMKHITNSSQSAPEAITAAEIIIQNTSPEAVGLAARQANLLQTIDIGTPELRALSGTPPKTTARRLETLQTPGAADLRTTPASQQNTPLMQLVPSVADPQTLSALGRIKTEVADSNRLLQEMSAQQLTAFTELSDKAQKLLITDKQVQADEVPAILDNLRAYPEIAQLMAQGLVKPEQLKDQAYVLSLKQSLAQSKAQGRPEDMGGRVRASKVPVFQREVESKRTPGLTYYRPPKYAAKSIFAQ